VIRVVEAIATAAGGAAVASSAGGVVGLAVPAGVVGAVNGAVSGWRGIYDWRCASGAVAFVLDSSWALTTTAAAAGSHLVALGTGGLDAGLSRRRNRHVYRRGFTPRRGFAVTLGNVVSGAGDTSVAARRELVDDHEEVHIWQARLLGPLFPVVYLGWMVLSVPLAVVGWVRHRPEGGLLAAIDRCAYWRNPLEVHAYGRAHRLRATRATAAALR
jgi:hypothetical protein